MAPTLYMTWGSPPVRAVLMTSKAIGLDLNLKEVNFFNGEHKSPEYLKINPQHTVPTLVDDDGNAIWDSHAIMPYLLTTYGSPGDRERLYPSDPKKRAIVDQRLYFESGVAFSRLLAILRPVIYQGKSSIDRADVEATYEIYDFLESFLEHGGTDWMAGERPTIADYSLLTTVGSFDVLLNIDRVKYKRLGAWLKRGEALPENAPNKKGLEIFRQNVVPLIKN